MTRFARAKGSKSSNKREPEDATPWTLMKEGLLNKPSVSNFDPKAQAQARKETLKSIQDTPVVSWSTFDEDDNGQGISKKNKKINNSVETKPENDVKGDKKKKNKTTKSKIVADTKDENEMNSEENKKHEEIAKTNDVNMGDKKTKKGKKRKNKNIESETNEPTPSPIKKMKNNKNDNTEQIVSANKKRQNSNDNNNEQSITKKKKFGKNNDSKNGSIQNKNEQNNQNDNKTSKFPMHNKNREFKNRKKPVPEPFTMDINGIDVEIVRYDGFPIKKEDAIRLNELKTKLHTKGIHSAEIKKIIKLERRNAEKALSRAKKHVCFNCRKSGHNLSECPELNKGEGTGICFKCGSTEHTHFECKVVKKADFKFAQCFICKEQGHISNQCPDNPRGLYPKGGACKLCGDVTHLKRFCPTITKQDDVTIDSFLDEGGNKSTAQKKEFTNVNKPKKYIKF